MEDETRENILKEWVNLPSPELNSLITISFKAGRDSRKTEIEELMSIAFKDGERIGKNNVVMWVEEEDAIDRMCRERWQAFLKETE